MQECLHVSGQFNGWPMSLQDSLDATKPKLLTSQAAAFYEESIKKLVPRYDKCLNNGGEYVEK